MWKFKKKVKVKNGWYDITLSQFNKIKNLDLNEFIDQIKAAEILLNIDADDMKWSEFSKECNKLDFLNEQIPVSIIRKSYIINGRVYECCPNLNDLSVARYMDFTNLLKTNEYEKILSVVLIPEGCDYGNYDMEQVYTDILDMSIVDVFAIFNFFIVELRTSLKVMKDYSVKMLKKDKELAKAILDIMDYYCMSDRLLNGQD